MSHLTPGQEFPTNPNKISGISLEQVELEMVLGMNKAGEEDFLSAVRNATRECNSDFLFDFPAERFPHDCESVACVRLNTPGHEAFCYIYREAESSNYSFVPGEELDPEFRDFAESYVEVMERLRPLISPTEEPAEKH